MATNQVPHRIRDILRKPDDRRTAKERKRLRTWERSVARAHLPVLEHELAELAASLGPHAPVVYHDPAHPVFSKECRQGRPEDCRWYPCGNDVHLEAWLDYHTVAQLLQTGPTTAPITFSRAS